MKMFEFHNLKFECGLQWSNLLKYFVKNISGVVTSLPDVTINEFL